MYYANDYPLGYTYYRDRLKKAFLSNREVTDAAKIEQLIERGHFVIREVEALYKLKKYRTLKKNYYDQDSERDEHLNNFLQKQINGHTREKTE